MYRKPFKPDPRILILQTIVVAVLGGSSRTIFSTTGLFLVVDFLLLFWFGIRTFLTNLLSFAIMYGILLTVTWIPIPVLSFLFPPFLTMILRIYPAFLSLKILSGKAPMDELFYTLDRMHLPKTLSIPLMVVYRYVPTLLQELRAIHESLKMRELNLSFTNLKHPVATLENYIVPLLYRSEKLAEELSAASLCKGLSSTRKRTCCTKVSLTAIDYFYLLGMVLITVLLILLNHVTI